MRLSTFIIAAIVLSIQEYADKYRNDDLNKTLDELEADRGLPNIKTYDFIIVGGGAAGCVLAGRLSEHFTVLLLESGGSPVPATYNPYLNHIVDTHPEINNFFNFQKQINSSPTSGEITVTPMGRMLGGSWSHNGNLYNRGSPHDYDNYAITGDESWSYRNILQHFKTLENFNGRLVNENERHRFYGKGGPLHVESDWPPIMEGWIRSARELGYNIGDPNGYQREGFSPIVKSIKNGERVSTYTALVKPFESNRSTLKVLRYSQVQKILINGNKRTYGVTYFRHGIPEISHASKEVIISAGTLSSPLLLMKSGVGPRAVLENARIPLKQDLPGVGQNLRNHAVIRLRFTVNKPNWNLLPQLEKEMQMEEDLNLYHNMTDSVLFSQLDYSPQAFIVSPQAKAKGQSHWPDILMLFQLRPSLIQNQQIITLGIEMTRPESVGEIGLNTTAFLGGERDDTKLAIIDFRQLSQRHDVDVMIEGIKFGLKIMEQTTTFQAMNVTYRHDPPEACRELTPRSDEYWRCHIRERARLVHHLAGSCKMGRASDPFAVVDSKLRVKGIKNLRVVDSGIMPQPTNANIAAPTMVIAEKGVQEIFKQYLRPLVMS